MPSEDKYGRSTSTIATDDANLNPSELEKIAKEKGLSSSQAHDVRQGAESINYLSELLNEYVASGEKDALDAELANNNYRSSKIPPVKVASNQNKNAAAFTDTENIIGANLNLEKAIEQLMHDGGVSRSVAEYILITHELIHTAQPDYVKQNGVAITEADAERVLIGMLYKKAEQGKTPEEKKEWEKGANYTLARYATILNNPLMEYGIFNKPATPEDYKKLVMAAYVIGYIAQNHKKGIKR
jgi:hypothetical protein